MSILNKYGPCVGFTLYKFFNKRAEIWFIPGNYEIVEHSHPNEDVELMFVFGKTEFYKRNIPTDKITSHRTSFCSWLRCFSVKHDDAHWFRTSSWPLVFINFQTFLNNHEPVSAAIDFKEF